MNSTVSDNDGTSVVNISGIEPPINISDDIQTTLVDENEDIDFQILYEHYVRDAEEERIEAEYHDLYLQFVRDTEAVTFENNPNQETDDKQTQTYNVDVDLENGCNPWEKHSTGIASRIMKKMGYKGKGLGKTENGITEPIRVEKKDRFEPTKGKNGDSKKRKLVYILSDSMLNQLDQKRLSKKYDVIVKCHGGCTLKCAYTHLPHAIDLNPDYIIIHISTNDCTTKTSCQVKRELKNLMNYLQERLPDTKPIFSLPTVRSDKSQANVIIRNLNVKLRKSYFSILDNSNINYSHLGRKGLHFNPVGVKIAAGNIISLIRSF